MKNTSSRRGNLQEGPPEVMIKKFKKKVKKSGILELVRRGVTLLRKASKRHEEKREAKKSQRQQTK